MTPQIFAIPAPCPGQLFIMPKPPAEGLHNSIQHYRAMGVDLVVSLLQPAEATAFSLGEEGRICSENNVDFLNFPIPDMGLPDRDRFKSLVHTVKSRLRQSDGVAVHCRAGIGRSGMLACCVLAEYVGPARTAIERVGRARGVAVPDTAQQRAFIESIVAELDSQAATDPGLT